jgi:hypothetical protein
MIKSDGIEYARKQFKTYINKISENYSVDWIKNYNCIDDSGDIYFPVDLSVPSKPREVNISSIGLHLEPLKTRGWSSDEMFIKLHNEKRLVFSNATDMIPLIGFYGAWNVLDYLYPYESDVKEGGAWEGARIYRSEENMTDYEGNEIDYVKLNILYNSTCTLFGLFPVTGKEARYVVLKSVFEAEFDTLTVGVLGWDNDTIADVIFEKTYSADDVAAMMGGDPYLILDTEGLLDGADLIDRIWMRIDGMERENPIYLKQLIFCADEAEVETYTGISLSVTETTAETDPETSPDTSDTTTPQNDAPVKPSVTESDTTGGEGTQSGCASAVGAGSVILPALGAAVVLTKKKD